jgi:thiaminase/transcriptional activator TenA
MKWSEKAWEAIIPVYSKILELPFIQELINGTLDNEKFTFYIRQDALYLSDYGKVLTGIASKLKKPSHIEPFISFAGESMAVEKALHQSFVKELSAETEPSPSCLLYTSYLLKQLANEPIEVVLAAVLPCFWIYKEVGDYILGHPKTENNPYQSWIDTYGGDDFAKSVHTAINICDEIASECTLKQQEAMIDAFVMCSKLEYMFWDSAYKLEKWNI